ncbi:MAG: hypothetical protein ACR2P4_08740 [Gammaproteobacteria bacterium]
MTPTFFEWLATMLLVVIGICGVALVLDMATYLPEHRRWNGWKGLTTVCIVIILMVLAIGGIQR